jgi:hypothetical protein
MFRNNISGCDWCNAKLLYAIFGVVTSSYDRRLAISHQEDEFGKDSFTHYEQEWKDIYVNVHFVYISSESLAILHLSLKFIHYRHKHLVKKFTTCLQHHTALVPHEKYAVYPTKVQIRVTDINGNYIYIYIYIYIYSVMLRICCTIIYFVRKQVKLWSCTFRSPRTSLRCGA